MLRVTTESSAYLIDLDAGTVIRLPRDGVDLRRDTEELQLLAVNEIEVGTPMRLLLRVREDGHLTYRVTTPVVNIQIAP